MTESRFPDSPPRIKQLPIDKRGFPIPKFVQWFNGEPDFRVMNPTHLHRCIRFNRCWICGDQLGAFKSFVIGPMCCVNRISAEPPSHYDCARFAAIHCPFLSQPLAKRGDLDDIGGGVSAGIMIDRNPGVAAIWTVRRYSTFQANGILFDIGEPERVEFYARGRRATIEEIAHSVETGLPVLETVARAEGVEAMKAFVAQLAKFERMLEELTV